MLSESSFVKLKEHFSYIYKPCLSLWLWCENSMWHDLEEADWQPAKLGTSNNPCNAHENTIACDLLFKSSLSIVLWLIFSLFTPPLLLLTWQVSEISKNRQLKCWVKNVISAHALVLLKDEIGDVSGTYWSVQIGFGKAALHKDPRGRCCCCCFLKHLYDDLWKIVPDACCNSNFLRICWEARVLSSRTVRNVPAVSLDVWSHSCESDLRMYKWFILC